MYIRQKTCFLIAIASLAFAPSFVFAQESSENNGESENTEIAADYESESSADEQTDDSESSKNASSEEIDEYWYYDKIIRSINFKGLKSVASKDVDGVTNAFLGKKFTDELFSEMLDRIYALDFFDDIEPEALPGDPKRNTVAITFTVKEKPVVARIYVNGNREIRSTEIKDVVSTKEKDVFIPSKISIDERAVRNFYLSKGFTNVKFLLRQKRLLKESKSLS